MADLEHTAIERIQEAAKYSVEKYKKPLAILISGGKDSSVITDLAIKSKAPVEFVHSHTTADAPETVRFVRGEFKRLEGLGYNCILNMPKYKGLPISMWGLIPIKTMPPDRFSRYCCEVLKENFGADRFVCTGVRWDESSARKNSRGIYEKNSKKKENRIILNNDNDDCRMIFENCRLKGKRTVNPIVDWETSNVLDYVESCKIPLNVLYGEGFDRVGCIGCPLAKTCKRKREFDRWPKYRNMYIKAFDRMLAIRKKRGMPVTSWKDGVDVFYWWMSEENLRGQLTIPEVTSEVFDE